MILWHFVMVPRDARTHTRQAQSKVGVCCASEYPWFFGIFCAFRSRFHKTNERGHWIFLSFFKMDFENKKHFSLNMTICSTGIMQITQQYHALTSCPLLHTSKSYYTAPHHTLMVWRDKTGSSVMSKCSNTIKNIINLHFNYTVCGLTKLNITYQSVSF